MNRLKAAIFKQAFPVLTALMTAVCLAACQPTPEETVVVNKNEGVLESAIKEAAEPTQASYYLMPVWNICGDMYYHYKDSYPTGESNTYVLDEKNERNVWRASNDKMDYSILTLNAVDGSVIPRNPWT
jgi:hypothetical protein